MRVDLSPRLGDTRVSPNRGERSTANRVANQPQGLTAGVEQSHELNLNSRFTLL